MEDKIKDKWLKKLKLINSNWKDGDLDNQNKTADLVNDKLKLAIELKNDTVFKLKLNVVNEFSLITLSNRYRGYGKDANHKFSFYADYKTILLIESRIYQGLLQSVFNGIQVVNLNTRKSFLKNKNLWESYPQIGCYLIRSDIEDTIFEDYYFQNPVADKQRILEKEEVNECLHISSNFLFKNSK